VKPPNGNYFNLGFVLSLTVTLVLACTNPGRPVSERNSTSNANNTEIQIRQSPTLLPRPASKEDITQKPRTAPTNTQGAVTGMTENTSETSPADASNVRVSQKQDPSSPANPGKRVSRGFILGPRGGCYYLNGNGKKTYVDHSFCYE
jgi:hypothetical protein